MPGDVRVQFEGGEYHGSMLGGGRESVALRFCCLGVRGCRGRLQARNLERMCILMIIAF